MKKLFTILLLLVANDLLAQDSIEVKSIDSFIAYSSLIGNKEFTATESFPNLEECSNRRKQIIDHKTVYYHFINKNHIFKVSHIWHNKNYTGQITSYYFENKKLIKVETFVSNELNQLEKVHSIYYKNSNFLFSKELQSDNENIKGYLNRAKQMLKKAKHLSVKSYY